MLKDDVITKLAEETVEDFKQELLETAKETIKSEYRKRILKDLNKRVITKLDHHLSYNDEINKGYCNSVVEFLKDGSTAVEGSSVGEVYLAYSVFCRENNLNSMSKISFSKEIQKHTGLSSKITNVNGRSMRIFRKSEVI